MGISRATWTLGLLSPRKIDDNDHHTKPANRSSVGLIFWLKVPVPYRNVFLRS